MPEGGVAPGPDVRVRPATAADGAEVLRLLAAAGLPPDGVVESLPRFVVAERGHRLVGVAGLEVHGRDGILRSVAVAEEERGRGLGVRLTDAVVAAARDLELRRLYLLTTTADGWFPRFGFRRIERAAASPEVQGSVEFREACPASAVTMVLELNTDGEATS